VNDLEEETYIMKKMISIVLVALMCVSISLPAFADTGVDSQSTAQPHFIAHITKYITTNAGISMTVVISINDSTGQIIGVQSATITKLPDGILEAKIVNTNMQADYVLFSLNYRGTDGNWHADSAYCYAGYGS